VADLGADAGTIETRKEAEKDPRGVVSYWLAQEKLAEQDQAPWRRRARKVVRRYRDERPDAQRSRSKFNILWANIRVLKPTLYARTPKPDIAPRFIDQDEGVVRLAAQILERTLTYLCDRHDIDSVLRSVVEDRLLPGAGFARVKYEPTYGEPEPDPDAAAPEEGKEPVTYRPVKSETVRWVYAFWEDVAWGPSRRWEEAPWLRFRSYMTRDELVERFGAELGKKVTLDYTPKGAEGTKDAPADVFKKATVHEYWEKATGKVVFIAPSYQEGPLDTVEDPLELDGFWPCPKPLLATTTNDKMVPVPDFVQYQDQADALDIIEGRIDKLTRALRVAGVYAASEKATLDRLLTDEGDNRLIPVEDWAMFAQQKGGLEGTILWLPIKDIAAVLDSLYQQHALAKERLYEITGLSDIMRGQTAASETATAQQLKSQYGTISVADAQKDVARFARDMFRLAGQVAGKQFDPKTLSAITGLPELPAELPAPTAPMPMALPGPPQIAPASPSAGPAPQGPAPALAAQPGAGASPTAPPQGATPPVPSRPDPMAEYQKAMAAWQANQAERARKQQEFATACALLKDDVLRCYRIDIEADSTIAPDEQAEKQARTEFVTALGTLITQSAPLVQAMPKEGGALVSEALKFVTHGFRAGRPLQEAIDRFAEALDDLPPAQPKADPEVARIEADAMAKQKQLELDDAHRQRELAAKAQHEQARLEMEAQARQRHDALKAQQQSDDASQRRQDAADGVAVKIAGIAADERVAVHKANLEHERGKDKAEKEMMIKGAVAAHGASLAEAKAGQEQGAP
jgi:hypothetical protein